VWIIPIIVLVVSFAVLVALFRRWQVRGEVHASDADRALVGAALEADLDDDGDDALDDEGSGR